MVQSESNVDTAEKQLYVLRLYIADSERNSQLARENLDGVCSEYLEGRCRIEEIDVLVDFESALEDRIFVTPALILLDPGPRVVIVGNLADRERVISALHLE